MSTAAQFAATPNAGSVLLVAKDAIAANIVPTSNANTFAVLTGGSSGTKVNEIVVEAGATTEAGLVYIWRRNNTGPVYWLYDTIVVTAVTVSVGSSPVAGFRARKQYSDLHIPSGWALYASHNETNTTNQSIIIVSASGGDY